MFFPSFFPVYFPYFYSLLASFWPGMDARYCSTCVKKLSPPFFLQDAIALPQSKVFATCYICREKKRLHLRKRKSTALQELDSLDSNIPPPAQRRALPALRAPFRSSVLVQAPTPPVRPPTPLVISTGEPTLLPMHPIASFLPIDQWQTIHDFHTHLGTIKMDTCRRCNARWFDIRLKDGVCHNCFLKDKGGQTPFLFSWS
jgi:hypothetical protein